MRGGVIPEKALGGCCGLCLCVRAAVSRGERHCGFVEVLPLRPIRLVLFFTCTPSCLPPHGGLSIPPLDASAAAPRKQDTKGLLLNSTEPGIGAAGNTKRRKVTCR
jgi:hypothetical protein